MKKRAVFLIFSLSVLFLSCAQKEPGTLPPGTSSTNTNVVRSKVEEDINTTISKQQFHTGMIRFYKREYQAAIQVFNKALSYDPMNLQARYYLAFAYLQSGYAKNALTEWENLTKLGGGNYQVRQKLNDLYFRLAMDKPNEDNDVSKAYILSRIYNGRTEGMHKVLRPSFITYDASDDHFYVSTAGTKYVVEMDGNGQVLREIGRKIGDFSEFGLPTGVVVTKDKIFVADFKADKIFTFEKESGKFMKSFGVSGSGKTNISGPMGMYLSPDDYLYIVDNGNNRVQKFDMNGNWVQSIGEGELNLPTDIVGTETMLFVSDTGNSCVIKYDAFGNKLAVIGKGVFKEPRGLYLKGRKLYISDAKQGVFIYHLDSGAIDSLGVDRGKLNYPFDICSDSKDILYNTDFNSDRIAVYIPLEMRYANLGVSVAQIWTEHYPQNFLHLRVWDKLGRPVYNLTESDVLLSEEGVNIPILRFGPTYAYRDKMSVRFVVDHSLAMKSHLPELEESLRAFLTAMSGDDKIDLTTVSDESKRLGEIRANVLRPMDFLEKQPFRSDVPVEIGKALYNAVSSLLNNNRNRAIVVFTSGEIGEDSFKTYDPNVIYTFAKQNAIPIYVVAFSDKNKDVWKRLASETFGHYYTLSENAKILALHDEIKHAKPLEYIISYEGLNLKGLKNFWVNVHIKVKYKTMVGVDDTGYFVPEMNSENSIKLR